VGGTSGLLIALHLPDHVVGITPQQPVRCDLLGAHGFTGVDPGEEFLLGVVLDGLPPVLHEPADVSRQHLVAHLLAVGAEPGVSTQNPVRLPVHPRTSCPVNLQAGLGFCQRLHRAAEPIVAQPGRPFDGSVSDPGDPQWWMWSLYRPRVHGELRKAIETPVVGGVLVLPDEPQDGESLLQPCTPGVELRTLDLVLQRPPAQPDTEGNPAVGELVDRGHLLGDPDRVVHRQLEDAGAEAQRAGAYGDGCQKCQRVGEVARHEMVVTDRRRIKSGLFRFLGQLEGLPKRIG
jgi:hypothetical protein